MRGVQAQAQDAFTVFVGRSGVPSEPLWLWFLVCVLLCWGSNSALHMAGQCPNYHTLSHTMWPLNDSSAVCVYILG